MKYLYKYLLYILTLSYMSLLWWVMKQYLGCNLWYCDCDIYYNFMVSLIILMYFLCFDICPCVSILSSIFTFSFNNIYMQQLTKQLFSSCHTTQTLAWVPRHIIYTIIQCVCCLYVCVVGYACFCVSTWGHPIYNISVTNLCSCACCLEKLIVALSLN